MHVLVEQHNLSEVEPVENQKLQRLPLYKTKTMYLDHYDMQIQPDAPIVISDQHTAIPRWLFDTFLGGFRSARPYLLTAKGTGSPRYLTRVSGP